MTCHYLFRYFIIIGITMTIYPFKVLTQETDEYRENNARRTKYKQIFDQLLPVTIYGKVVDQDNIPVPDADVEIGWESAALLLGKLDPGQTSMFTSDSKGLWEFKIQKPHRAFVRFVHKNGYDFSRKENPSRNLIYHPTTKEKPIISVLRKKGHTTFLILRPSGSKGHDEWFRTNGVEFHATAFDLLAKRGEKISPQFTYADLKVEVRYNPDNDGWILNYSVSDGIGGIIVSNDLLYEAPLDGYQTEVVLNGPPEENYIYLRSRNPAIYSRLHMEYSTWRESSKDVEVIRILYKAWINPYGERNLEYETELDQYWQLEKQLEHDAKEVLWRHQLPPKPDLVKLINEAKEKAGKDNKK